MHDHREMPGLDYRPRDEFVISRVGTTYEASFQPLGVSYYEYMR